MAGPTGLVTDFAFSSEPRLYDRTVSYHHHDPCPVRRTSLDHRHGRDTGPRPDLCLDQIEVRWPYLCLALGHGLDHDWRTHPLDWRQRIVLVPPLLEDPMGLTKVVVHWVDGLDRMAQGQKTLLVTARYPRKVVMDHWKAEQSYVVRVWF